MGKFLNDLEILMLKYKESGKNIDEIVNELEAFKLYVIREYIK
jgi:hypothetical protein